MRGGGFALVGLIVLAGLLFEACSGASGPGVASLGRTLTTTTAPSSQGSTPVVSYTAAIKYSRCMRTHGELAFPDPNPNGTFSNVPDQFTTRFISAQKTCEHLLPNGGQPSAAQIEQALTSGLKYSACMRVHGVLNFPEPMPAVIAGSGFVGYAFVLKRVGRNPIDINQHSPQYQKANRYCESH